MKQSILTKVQRWSNLSSDQDQPILSTEELYKIVKLPKIFTWIKNLLSRYQWQTSKMATFVTALDDIQRRMEEKRLYLGVIGEFSSGKSTFINALLEDELLTTSVLQATTASITKPEYGKELDVEIQTNRGKIKRFSQKGIGQILLGFGESIVRKLKFSFGLGTTTTSEVVPKSRRDEIKDFIHSVTADESMASQIKEVRIFHPSKVLQDELVIVDTPGTDSRNQRHTQIARTAAEDICDLVLVIIPGNRSRSEYENWDNQE
ncbi:MAG: dynamin family protein [Thermoguttaceae bacterium]|nr:dynamin family protein [Thermoguttaceae bacterium]